MINFTSVKGVKEKINIGILTNIFIRGLNLITKFFLSVFLVKFSSDGALLGTYTIFSTTVILGIYFVGFEFYTYSQREYLKYQLNDLAPLIKRQFVFHLISYFFLIPIILFFASLVIPVNLLIFFSVIFIFEHINQELYRLLIVIKKPTIANINYFLRSGVWIISFAIVSFFHKERLNIQYILDNWLLGQITCFFFSLYFFKKMNWKYALKTKTDWGWIKKGVKISTTFFLSGIILKTIEYAERFFLQKIIDEKAVGVYFFFYNIAFTPYIFFSSSIVLTYIPKLISSFQNGGLGEYKEEKLAFEKNTRKFIYFFLPVDISLFLILTLFYIRDPLYYNEKNIFWGLLIASVITIISEIQYLDLYVRHKDKSILKSFVITLIVCLVAHFILINFLGIKGAVIAKILVSMTLFFTRWLILKKIYRAEIS